MRAGACGHFLLYLVQLADQQLNDLRHLFRRFVLHRDGQRGVDILWLCYGDQLAQKAGLHIHLLRNAFPKVAVQQSRLIRGGNGRGGVGALIGHARQDLVVGADIQRDRCRIHIPVIQLHQDRVFQILLLILHPLAALLDRVLQKVFGVFIGDERTLVVLLLLRVDGLVSGGPPGAYALEAANSQSQNDCGQQPFFPLIQYGKKHISESNDFFLKIVVHCISSIIHRKAVEIYCYYTTTFPCRQLVLQLPLPTGGSGAAAIKKNRQPRFGGCRRG